MMATSYIFSIMAPSTVSTNENSVVANSSPKTQKCPLCRRLKVNFYCNSCVHNGLFHSLKEPLKEIYMDKFTLFIKVMYSKKKLEEVCLKKLIIKQKTEILCSKIRQSKERNRILKSMIEDKKRIIELNNEKLIDITGRNKKCYENFPSYDQMMQVLVNDVRRHRSTTEELYKMLNRNQNHIRKLTKLQTQHLFKFIFPVLEVMSEEEIESDFVMICNLSKISKKSKHLTKDQWEFVDYSREKQYCIVAPSLPSSGNYSAYNVSASQSQDTGLAYSLFSDKLNHNSAVTISAALTYTIQLVQILSFYFNVRLPYHMDYSDFSPPKTCNYMSERKFIRRVATLNANILFLCLSQNVDPYSLNKDETIHNILQLIRSENEELPDE